MFTPPLKKILNLNKGFSKVNRILIYHKRKLIFLPFTLFRKGKNRGKEIRKLKITNTVIKKQHILKLW